MEKRATSLFLLSFLILNIFAISLINADTPSLPDLPGTGEINLDTGLPSELDKLRDIGETLTDKEKRQEYLAQEWKKMPVIASIDAGFTKASFVFLILFGQHYSFSIKLLVVALLWGYFLFLLYQLIKIPSSFSSSTNFFISLLLTIILAQLQIFSSIGGGITWLVFTDKPWWQNLIILAIIVGVFIGVYYLVKYVSKISKKKRAKFKIIKKYAEEEFHRKILKAGANAAQIAFGNKEISDAQATKNRMNLKLSK